MDLAGSVIVLTGAGSGIGAELARRFAAEGAAQVVLTDLDGVAVQAVADRIGPVARAERLDVTDEAAVAGCVRRVLEQHGRIDLFCSNAGITSGSGLEASDDVWQRSWGVNVQAHVYAARAVLPAMLERGDGYLLQTCSAAGLLAAVGDAPYTVTKHAAVGFAEWLAITYGGRGHADAARRARRGPRRRPGDRGVRCGAVRRGRRRIGGRRAGG
jgi:NAD(P)-dependent dehydrogenase (short-subunit alcohol dehydrogenase family)